MEPSVTDSLENLTCGSVGKRLGSHNHSVLCSVAEGHTVAPTFCNWFSQTIRSATLEIGVRLMCSLQSCRESAFVKLLISHS